MLFTGYHSSGKLSDKIKRDFFQAVSILLNGCTTWTLTKPKEKRLDGNYARMLRAVLNKPKKLHSIEQRLYGHLPPLSQTIQVRRTRHAGHSWRKKGKFISDVLLKTPAYRRVNVGRPAKTYLHQLSADTRRSIEDLPEAMIGMDGKRDLENSVLSELQDDDDHHTHTHR